MAMSRSHDNVPSIHPLIEVFCFSAPQMLYTELSHYTEVTSTTNLTLCDGSVSLIWKFVILYFRPCIRQDCFCLFNTAGLCYLFGLGAGSRTYKGILSKYRGSFDEYIVAEERKYRDGVETNS